MEMEIFGGQPKKGLNNPNNILLKKEDFGALIMNMVIMV